MTDYEKRALEAEKRLEELTKKIEFLENHLASQQKQQQGPPSKKEEKKDQPKKEVSKKEEKKELKKDQLKKEELKKEEKKDQLKKEISKEEEKKDQSKNQMNDNEVESEFPRASFNKLMTQRFFIAPSFEIYGGVAGLFDLGPPACSIKANILNLWRQHFILYENMLEVDCTSVTPFPVLKTSGHVAKFSDLMVKDVKTGNCFRADHLLEHHLKVLLADKNITEEKRKEYELVIAQADTYSSVTMGEMIKKYGCKAPETHNDLTDPEPFNLMFSTSIGPTGTNPGFLRPETAQGIFVNFKRLLEYNGGKLPFAGAQIGQAFRNEIAPRSGLLRVREFTLAEIEHFVNSEDKSHPRFSSVSDLVLTLFSREDQITTQKTVRMTVGEAVGKRIIANETLGYFLARTHLFLIACGIQPNRLRFRQHLKDEMAHYASDCWDAEIHTSYGWIECVGHADRSCYDLSQHALATKQPLHAFIEYKEGARDVDVRQLFIEKSIVGKQYAKDAQILIDYLNNLDETEQVDLETSLKSKGKVEVTISSKPFEITDKMVTFKMTKKRVTGKNITPGVIEPSFGIGRILYSILEHSYHVRENDEQRGYLKLPPAIAPVKVSVLPLLSKDVLFAYIPKITSLLTYHNISHKVDDSGQTIGKKYARTDEIGIPFGITIDFQTTEDNSITLRERDTTRQVRIKLDEVVYVIKDLVDYKLIWNEVEKKYPVVEVKE